MDGQWSERHVPFSSLLLVFEDSGFADTLRHMYSLGGFVVEGAGHISAACRTLCRRGCTEFR